MKLVKPKLLRGYQKNVIYFKVLFAIFSILMKSGSFYHRQRLYF